MFKICADADGDADVDADANADVAKPHQQLKQNNALGCLTVFVHFSSIHKFVKVYMLYKVFVSFGCSQNIGGNRDFQHDAKPMRTQWPGVYLL